MYVTRLHCFNQTRLTHRSTKPSDQLDLAGLCQYGSDTLHRPDTDPPLPSSLDQLDLAGLGLGDAGALHLSAASLPSLTALDLALNGITSAGATSLASAMARPMATVGDHGID